MFVLLFFSAYEFWKIVKCTVGEENEKGLSTADLTVLLHTVKDPGTFFPCLRLFTSVCFKIASRITGRSISKSKFSIKLKAWQSLMTRFFLLLTRWLKCTKEKQTKIQNQWIETEINPKLSMWRLETWGGKRIEKDKGKKEYRRPPHWATR